MDDTVVLTPAQEQFLKQNIPGFDRELWALKWAGIAGSDRMFVRIYSPPRKTETYILVMWNSDDKDWKRFIDIERDLRDTVNLLPRIYSSDDTHGLILEEDLGTQTLCAYSLEHPSHNNIETMYQKVLDALACWQSIGHDSSQTIQKRTMDLEMFLWESDYFALHCVTEFFGCEDALTEQWHSERRCLAKKCINFPTVCIHRDFQSENIIISNNEIRFVDFQGARRGPAGYDLASLLYDPYVDILDDTTIHSQLEYYQQNKKTAVSIDEFYSCAIQRLMQALGAYGNLFLHKGKKRYRDYIPIALQRLDAVLSKVKCYPAMSAIVRQCRENL